MTSTVSSKGQITLPKAVRDRLGLRPGTPVEFELVERGVTVRKGRKGGQRAVDAVRGILVRHTSTNALLSEMRGPAPRVRRRSS